jgi:hypothetical protein
MVLVVYCPGLQNVVFMTQKLDDITYISFLAFTVIIILYSEIRKLYARKNVNGWIAKNINW